MTARMKLANMEPMARAAEGMPGSLLEQGAEARGEERQGGDEPEVADDQVHLAPGVMWWGIRMVWVILEGVDLVEVGGAELAVGSEDDAEALRRLRRLRRILRTA